MGDAGDNFESHDDCIINSWSC